MLVSYETVRTWSNKFGHKFANIIKQRLCLFSSLLKSYPSPRVIITDKLPSYTNPIKYMTKAGHRRHKGLSNRVENMHQPTSRKEKSLLKFKSPSGLQRTLTLMGQVRNILTVPVARYKNSAATQKQKFNEAIYGKKRLKRFTVSKI